MCILRVLLFVSILIVTRCQDEMEGKQECQTPDRIVGHCIPVPQCQPMFNVLVTLKLPMSQYVRQQLAAYSCRFGGNETYVCCPRGPIIVRYKLDGENESPPDVSSHKNIRLLPTDCGVGRRTNRVSNGPDVQFNEFPWVALLIYKTEEGLVFQCEGTIINERYILTAAHCTYYRFLSGVRVGGYNQTNQNCTKEQDGSMKCFAGYQELAVEKIHPHPLFDFTTRVNNIGLIRVSKINYNSEYARPVCLPTGDYRNDVLKNVIVTKWKRDEKPGLINSQLLRFDVAVLSLEECKSMYRNEFITTRHVCVGGKNKNISGPGSSGAPLHTLGDTNNGPVYIQHGLSSFSAPDLPFVFEGVAYYMDWILDTMKP